MCIWSVDHILAAEEPPCRREGRSLVRMVHLKDRDGLGIRYILAARELIDVRKYVEGDDSPKFSFGLAYVITQHSLRDAVQTAVLGGLRRRIPVLTAQNWENCVRRRPEVEVGLRREIGQLLEGAPPPAELGTEPGDKKAGWGTPARPSVRVHVLHVGQGDAILLEFPGGALWLIDAYFWERKRYDKFVATMGLRQLDRVIFSHFHIDHIRYGIQVIRDLRPSEVIVTGTLIHATAGTRNLLREASDKGILRVLRGSMTYDMGLVKVRLTRTADFPRRPAMGVDPNEHAIAVGLRTVASRALLSGDIPGVMLRQLVSTKFMRGGSYRFYKVTHHCSRTGDDSGLFSQFPPNHAATSCSNGNRYGHPHDPPEGILHHLTALAVPAGTHDITCKKGDLRYDIT